MPSEDVNFSGSQSFSSVCGVTDAGDQLAQMPLMSQNETLDGDHLSFGAGANMHPYQSGIASCNYNSFDSIDDSGAAAAGAAMDITNNGPTISPTHDDEIASGHSVGMQDETELGEMSGGGEVMCGLCTFKGASRPLVDRHLKTHDKEADGMYHCGNCDYQTERKSNIQRHRRVHTLEKPFACGICKYRTAQRGDLTKHMRIHSGERPYACEWDGCNYRAAVGNHLAQHMQTHTQEKRFPCNICSYRAGRKAVLQQHMKTHKNTVPQASAASLGPTDKARTSAMGSHKPSNEMAGSAVAVASGNRRSDAGSASVPRRLSARGKAKSGNSWPIPWEGGGREMASLHRFQTLSRSPSANAEASARSRGNTSSDDESGLPDLPFPDLQ